MKQITLQEQYNRIQNGKGNKETFLKEAKRQYPNMLTNQATFDEAKIILKQRSIISENLYVSTPKKDPDWFRLFDENMNLIEQEVKAVEKKTSKEVTDLQSPDKGYNYKDDKNINNVSGEQFRQGYYTELTDIANNKKTKQELIDLVIKNIDKNPLYYIEEAQFGLKGIGYTEDAVSLKPKQIKGKYISSGHGDPTTKDFPEGRIGTGYLDIKENKENNMISLVSLIEGPLGEKSPMKKKPIKEKKQTLDTKLAEIDKASQIVAMETKIATIDEIIESKTTRLNMVSEDESLSELVDSKKIKLMQREIKDLSKRKLKMEKVYEKMSGKRYTAQEVVTEMDPEAWKEQNGMSADWAPRNEEEEENK
tara:strand:+ start:696 stop:1790 length:1095 start_codon:yes stop_codon:yes gene_type:complete